MTGAQIVTKFNNMIDDTIDSDFAYQLLNDAKDEVEGMIAWEMLKKETSFAVAAGYSYTSALSTLPTRFAMPIRMTESNSYIDYDKYDFEDRYSKVNAPFGYFFDLAGGNIYLTSSNHNSKTMYFYYTATSADLTSVDTWAFPARFHSIIPLKMAELYYSADAGERGRSWDDKWSAQFERELNRMYAWDTQLKMQGRRPNSHNHLGYSPSPKAA